jgi:membrane protease subunit HflK
MNKSASKLTEKLKNPRKTGVAIVLALVLYTGFSSYYTVSAESVGVLQRFGSYQHVVAPGLHFKIPFGVDAVTLVPIKRQLKEEFGFGTAGATNPQQMSKPSEWKLETTIVTGDLNTALVEWVIEDSSHQSNRYTKLLICMRTLNETIKTYIYHRRERPCF